MRKDNVEIKNMILNTLAEIEYTHTYAFAIREHGMVKAAIVENADEILPLVTIAEKQASSHGAPWGVRMCNKQSCFEIIKAYAREVIDICSVDYLEAEYKTHGNRGGNNRGHIFETLFNERVQGTRPTSKNAKCIDTGDVIVNGEHIQCKFWNATVTTETTMQSLYTEYIARQ